MTKRILNYIKEHNEKYLHHFINIEDVKCKCGSTNVLYNQFRDYGRCTCRKCFNADVKKLNNRSFISICQIGESMFKDSTNYEFALDHIENGKCKTIVIDAAISSDPFHAKHGSILKFQCEHSETDGDADFVPDWFLEENEDIFEISNDLFNRVLKHQKEDLDIFRCFESMVKSKINTP